MLVNEQVLDRDYADKCPFYAPDSMSIELISVRRHVGEGRLYAQVVHAYLSAKPGGVDLLQHQLIIGGHSYGGNTA